MQRKIDILIKKLSVNNNVPKKVVEAIVRSQFECGRHHLQIGVREEPHSFVNVRFKHLGLLYSNPENIIRRNSRYRNRKTNQDE